MIFCSVNYWSYKYSPYSRSSRQVWHTFLILEQVWQTSVFLNLIRAPGHHLNTVNGRAQILHSFPYFSFIYWIKFTDLYKNLKKCLWFSKFCMKTCCWYLAGVIFFLMSTHNFISLYNTNVVYIRVDVISTSIIQKGVKRKSNCWFKSVSLDYNIIVLIINKIVRFTLNLQIIV